MNSGRPEESSVGVVLCSIRPEATRPRRESTPAGERGDLEDEARVRHLEQPGFLEVGPVGEHPDAVSQCRVDPLHPARAIERNLNLSGNGEIREDQGRDEHR
jgi:hypothetical protein